MMQEAIVALIVLYASCYLAVRYAPHALRRAMRGGLERAARRAGFHGLARRLAAASPAAPSCADGCGSCGGCDGESSAPRSPAPGAVQHISVASLRARKQYARE